MAEDLIPRGDVRDLLGFEEGGPVPPPTWVDIADTDKANKWIDEKVKPIQKVVDETYAVIVGFFETLLKGLEFVETLLVGIQDPISAILQEIIDIIQAILKDLRKAGFYITWDSAWKKAPLKPSNFAHGYQRVRQELTDKLTNEADQSRPEFSRLSSVFSITAYGGGGATNIRPLIKAIMKVISLFSVKASPYYSPPILDTPNYTKNFQGDKIAIPWPLELIEEDTEIGGIQVRWSNPPSKKENFFDVDLPPDSYAITVTTRSNPLPLFIEVNDPNSTSDEGKATVIKPMRLSQTTEEQATTIVAPRVNSKNFVDSADRITDQKPFLFAKFNGEKIPYNKFINETKTFYFKTSAFGAVIGGADYTYSLLFTELPDKQFDLVKQSDTEDFENYFIYMSSHVTENDSEWGDGYVIDERAAVKKDLDFGFNFQGFAPLNDCFVTGSSNDLRVCPLFSQPKRIKRNPKDKFKYITALKDSLVRFILVEEYFSQVVGSKKDPLNIDRIPPQQRNNLYSIFGVKDAKELYKMYKGDRDDVEDFRDEIEDMVRDALARILGRGMPSKGVLKTMESDLDLIVDTKNDKSPLLYRLLDEDFDVDKPTYDFEEDEENALDGNEGIYPNAFIGLEERSESDDLIQTHLKTFSLPYVSEALGENEQTFISNYKNTLVTDYIPFAKYLSEDIEKKKWGACSRVLTGLPKSPDTLGKGEWLFLRIFADGIPALEVFLEEILQFIKAFKKGLEGIIAAILRYINLLRERINSIRRFVDMIKRIIDLILSIRLPGGISYLMCETDGTEGFVEALSSSQNQPPSGEFIFGTYACFVFGGLPSILVDFILSLIEDDSTKETLNATGESGAEL